MSFLSTRAATFSFLLGFPLVHAFACSAPNRDYGVDGATGGSNAGASAKGGTAGNAGRANQGGTVGTSGGSGAPSNGGSVGDAGAGGIIDMMGGAAGDIGAGGVIVGPNGGTIGGPNGGTTGGPNGGTIGGPNGGTITTAGGPPGAGSPNGGGTTVGNGGGITVGSGGGITIGTGGGPTTCTPTGAEICNDGKDNDCNGFVDCVMPTGAFPEPNGAAAGKDVMITVNAPVVAGFTFQCRSARGMAVPDQVAWAACPSGNNVRITPRTAAESQDAASDGLWTTQVRAVFPGNLASDPIGLTYYMHHTLHTAQRCQQRATDQAFFTAGAAVVADAGAFGTATITRSPFIQLAFTPPASAHFNIATGAGTTKLMSLRRRFFRRADDHYMIMTRTYPSSRSNVCDAIDLRTHSTEKPTINRNRFYYDDCDAVVFNKNGAGVCLFVDTMGNVQKRTSHVDAYLRAAGFSPAADNFFWRKLLDKQKASDGYLHFMPKCTTAGCERTGFNIYLPDRDKFPYF